MATTLSGSLTLQFDTADEFDLNLAALQADSNLSNIVADASAKTISFEIYRIGG